MTRRVWLVVLLVGACHGGMSPASVDGAVSADAPAADAPIDAGVSPFSFEPATIDFGSVFVGSVSAPLHVVVDNTSGADIPGFALSLSDTAALTVFQTTCSSTLDHGGCSVDLEFAAQTEGDHVM